MQKLKICTSPEKHYSVYRRNRNKRADDYFVDREIVYAYAINSVFFEKTALESKHNKAAFDLPGGNGFWP
jgi:hypothetical protein